MEKYIRDQEGENQGLKIIVGEMYDLSLKVFGKSPDYVHSAYQCFIAARVVHGCESTFAFELGSGQGKSIIAFLIAAYYEKHQ